jgi:hypothetical protein
MENTIIKECDKLQALLEEQRKCIERIMNILNN